MSDILAELVWLLSIEDSEDALLTFVVNVALITVLVMLSTTFANWCGDNRIGPKLINLWKTYTYRSKHR